MQKVQKELLEEVETQLLEKEHSGCRALLRDDKVDLCSFASAVATLFIRKPVLPLCLFIHAYRNLKIAPEQSCY